jgi:sialate O-acetylesterase
MVSRLFPIMLATAVQAAVAFDPMIGDDMVLQRDQPIVIRGNATPGETVSVRLANDSAKAVAAADGSWEVRLRARPASSAALELTAAAPSGEARARNILMGDLWVCAGQSNMEWPLRLDQEAPEAAKMLKSPNRRVRLRSHAFPGQYSKATLKADQLADMRPDRFFKGAWGVDGPKVSPPFSAVGWWFAQRVQTATKVPVGMISWSVGGAPIESFIRPAAMAAEPAFAAKLKGDWERNAAIDGWVRQRAREHFGKAQEPRDERGIDHFYKPGFAWAAGPGRATWLPVKGVLWYQGESNSLSEPFAKEYPGLMKLMVADWRAQWGRPDLPFLWVQLSSIDTKTYKSQQWPLFRDNQRRLLAEIPGSGMAVSSDVGAQNDVHPRSKRPVGERLARWALHHVYGQRQVVPSGPLVLEAKASGGSVTVRFAHAKGLRTRDRQAVREVEVAGPDGTFAGAEAEIRGETLVIKSAGGKPAKVRYGWVPWSQGNLVNGEGLPASTFEVEIR